MLKYAPLALLACAVAAVIVAAPRPAREGLAAHDAAGKAYVVKSIPALSGGPWITARLRVNYVIAGVPGETYTVELWLGRTGDDRFPRFHFDTQEVTVPGQKGGNLTEVKGKFDRRYRDRDHVENQVGPGKVPLPDAKNYGWDCRLIVKKKGKVVSDTGVFKVTMSPVVGI